MDRVIEDALRRTSEIIGTDAACLWQWKPGVPGVLVLTHMHYPTGGPLPPREMDAQEFYPWTLRRVVARKATVIPSIEGLPEEAARDRETWRAAGEKAALVLPLSAWGNPLVGVLSFDSLREERSWPAALVDQLETLGGILADALVRKVTGTQLARSEAHLTSAIDVAELGFYEAAHDGQVNFLDRRTRHILGIPGDTRDAVRDFWLAHLHPADREGVLEASRVLLSGVQGTVHMLYRYLQPEGGMLWIDHLARVTARDAAGVPTHIIGVLKDITELKTSELALRNLAQRFELLTSTTLDAFWEFDREGRLVAVNEVACRMLGYSRDEMLGMSIADIEAVESPADVRRHIAALLEDREGRFETRHRCKDGRLIDVEVSTSCRSDAGLFIAFLRDITEKRHNDARLREALRFNRAVLASMVDGVAILSRRGVILAANDAWDRSMLETGRLEIGMSSSVGIDYPEAARRVGAGGIAAGIDAVLAGRDEHYWSEDPHSLPTGPRWYRLDVMPLRGADGGAVLVYRDVTDRKKSDVELTRLRMDVWHAHRVAQTGAIAASLAHELNQPLAAILSNAQAGGRLLAGPDPNLDEIRDILADIVQDDKRAAQVIVGLRAMLRRKETQRERLDLEEAVRQVLDLLHGELVSHDIEVEVQAAPGCSASVDRAQVQQVILNVVMNAIEAMEGGPPDRRRLEVSLAHDEAGHVVIAFRDAGPGIPEDVRLRVFDAFYTTKPHGMGIGLAICSTIIETHGGNLWFQNNDGQGVTFFISLPRSVPRRPAAVTGDQPGT